MSENTVPVYFHCDECGNGSLCGAVCETPTCRVCDRLMILPQTSAATKTDRLRFAPAVEDAFVTMCNAVVYLVRVNDEKP